jgi:hypothetical protein
VSRPNFDKTPVPDNSEVFLIPMIAGGWEVKEKS